MNETLKKLIALATFYKDSEANFIIQYPEYDDYQRAGVCFSLQTCNNVFGAISISNKDYLSAREYFFKAASLFGFTQEKFKSDDFFHFSPICNAILSDHRALIQRVSTYDPIKTGPIYFTAAFVKCVQCVIRDDREGMSPHLETMRKLSKRGWEKRYADLVQVFEGYLAGDKDLVMASLKAFQKKVSKEPERKLWSEVFVVEVAALAKLFLSKGMSLDTESLGLPKELMENKPLEKALGYPFMEDWMREAGL